MRKGDLDFTRDASRVRGKIRMRSHMKTASSMLWVTSSIDLDRQPALDPEIEKVGADRLGGQHVERRKRLVQQQDGRLDDERAGKADALAHAAGQFPRVGRSRNRRGRSGRSRRVHAGGFPWLARQALPVPLRHSAARSATERGRRSETPSRSLPAGPLTGWPR